MDCVHRQCFLEVFLSPCCDFHYSSIPLGDAVPSKGPKITGIQHGFPAWPLRTEIGSRFSNLWMILCTVDDDNFKLLCNFSLRNSFLILPSTIFRRSIGGIGDPLPILTSERHCPLRGSFYTQSCCQFDLISCKLVLQLFLICTFNFSGLLCATCPNFLECVSLMKSKISQYLAWHFKMSHFQHLICYLYSIVNKYKFMRFVNYCIAFLFTICTVSQLFWNWVCI